MAVDSLLLAVDFNHALVESASTDRKLASAELGSEFSLIPAAIKSVRALSLSRSRHVRDARPTVGELRQAELDCSRRCATQALRQAGIEIPRGLSAQSDSKCIVGLSGHDSDRSPNWPPGFVGSLSHSERWVWAAVAKQHEILSIGLDTSVIVKAGEAAPTLAENCNAAQRQKLFDVGLPANQACALLSSAKATFYRYWFPLLQRCWDFSDVELVAVTPRQTGPIPARRDLRHGTLQLRLKSTFSPGLALPDYLCPTAPLTVHYQIETPDVFTIAWQRNHAGDGSF